MLQITVRYVCHGVAWLIDFQSVTDDMTLYLIDILSCIILYDIMYSNNDIK